MTPDISRRDFIKKGSVVSAALAAVGTTERGVAQAEAPTVLPAIRLGDLEVSRLILGSNPIFGFSHQSDELSKEMVEYFTDENICALLDEAAAHGITAVAAPVYERWIRVFNRYLDAGGKLRIWIAQPDGPPEGMEDEIATAVEGRAAAVFVQGARAEEQFAAGRLDVLRRWVERIKGLGVPAGLAAHRQDVHLEVERQGFPTDFYFQCFYNPGHGEGYREEDRQRAVAAIRQIEKPVVAYKILAAGRLKAAEGFEFALRHLREKDGVCVGMYPKHHPEEVAENVALTKGQPT